MSLVQKFSCESHTEKQKWIAAVDRHAAATVQKIAGAHSVQDLLARQSEQIPDDAHSVQEVKIAQAMAIKEAPQIRTQAAPQAPVPVQTMTVGTRPQRLAWNQQQR